MKYAASSTIRKILGMGGKKRKKPTVDSVQEYTLSDGLPAGQHKSVRCMVISSPVGMITPAGLSGIIEW